MLKIISEYFNIPQIVLMKILISLLILIGLFLLKLIANYVVNRKVKDIKQAYHYRRIITYIFTLLMVLLIGPIWIEGFQTLTTFLGLTSAGLAIAMHDTVANIAGWLFIITRKPFNVGDRIEIGGIAGDVIDIRLFQFSLVEIRNWVEADQSTGRIVHVPNNKILREPISNFQTGFQYIWNEIKVLITFESNWKKAKEILSNIAGEKAEHLSSGAQKQIKEAARKYLIFYDKLTPIVYTSVKQSGVLLTIRYLVDPRQRRNTEQQIWEAILESFSREEDISLAYPTTRFYTGEESNKS
ncbi:MAG: mechanosensitive ion channel protein MscS [Desulfuromonas sp. SDB]|nr:MAG: mechanosensitive ion channel protein MscS [Desulfuromonas sp. SDB]